MTGGSKGVRAPLPTAILFASVQWSAHKRQLGAACRHDSRPVQLFGGSKHGRGWV